MKNNDSLQAWKALEESIGAALETYSNVHRGSGHFSMATTRLYERARNIVLEYLGLDKIGNTVVFCSPRRAAMLQKQFREGSYRCLSGGDFGLPLCIHAMVIKKNALPGNLITDTGGGNARLVAPGWVVWEKAPGRFEAGTPAIINVIAFARALQLVRKYGDDAFRAEENSPATVDDILFRDELEGFSGRELADRLRATLMGLNVMVPTREGRQPYINLDNAASTQTFSPVLKAFLMTLRQPLHVRQKIAEQVRTLCREVLEAPESDYEVIFTSNTTEAINLAAGNLAGEQAGGTEPLILNTLLEHNSNDLPWRRVPGHSLIRMTIDGDGIIDLAALEALLSGYNREHRHGNKRISLVAVSGASNVLGVFNDLGEICLIAHRYGAHVLADAAQMAAHRRLSMQENGIDYLAFSAHKAYAPFGTGVLVVRKGLMSPGPEEAELIRSSGEENAGGLASLGKALVLLSRIGYDHIQAEERLLTTKVLKGLEKIPGITVYGIRDPESPVFDRKGGVILFNLKGRMANRIANDLAWQGGIGVRYGCHCAHLLIKRLLNFKPFGENLQGWIVRLFLRMKLPGLTRISLGLGNTPEDIDRLLEVLGRIAGVVEARANITGNSNNPATSLLPFKVVKRQMQEFVEKAVRRVYGEV